MRDALALWTRLQDGRSTVCCSAADDDGHAPALNKRVPLDIPAPSKIIQDDGQLIEPRVDRASEPSPETLTQLIIKFWDAGPDRRAS